MEGTVVTSAQRFVLVVGATATFAMPMACGNVVASDAHEPGSAGTSSGAHPPETAPVEPSTPCQGPVGVETLADLSDTNLTTGRLIVDEGHVYVDTSRGTYRVRKCGGSVFRIADNAPGQYTASGLVQDRDHLYLAATAPTRGGFVRRIAKDGSSAEDLATSSQDLFGLTLVDDGVGRLYWVERSAGGGALRELLLTTGATATVATLPTAYSYGPFCSDAGGVSFLAMTGSNSGRYYTFTPSKGLSSPGEGPAAVEMVPGPPTDGEAPDVFFSFGHTGRNGVARLLRGGTSTVDVVADASAPYGLARHDRTIYFTDTAKGQLRRCVLATTTATPTCDETSPVSAGEDDPRFVATDAGAVYWTTWRGLLRRAPL